MVEALATRPSPVHTVVAERIADHRLDRSAEPQALPERREQPLQIAARAAGDGAPCRPLAVDQPVVLEERDEARRRIVEHLDARRRPDRGGHRDQVIVAEGVREFAVFEIAADRAVRELAGGAILDALAVEAQHLAQHPQEGRREEIALLREDRTDIGAAPFEPAAVERQRKAHVAALRGDAELGKHCREIGIVELVVDDEAGVDRDMPAVIVDVDGRGMAAGPRIGLEQRDVGGSVQRPGSGCA